MESGDSTTKFVPEYRRCGYKNRNRFLPEELRRRKETQIVSLRKQKRDEELLKRRRILTEDLSINLEIRVEEGNSTKTSNPAAIPVLKQILADLKSGTDVIAALKKLANLLSPQSSDIIPPIDEAIALNLVPLLMEYIWSNYYELQYQALWILANIASGTEKHTKYLIEEHKIIPLLLNLMTSTTSIPLKEEALLCLGNLCIDNLNGEEVRNNIIIGGGLVKVIEILVLEDDEFTSHISTVELKRKASWVFMQLCKTDQFGRLPSSNWNVLRYIVPQLSPILSNAHQDIFVLKDLLKSIQYLTHELLSNNRANTIMDFKIDHLIINKFLKPKKYNDLKVICIQIMKNLITATSQRATDTLIGEGLLKNIFYIFSTGSNSVELKKECCSLIGLICQHSSQAIQDIFDVNLIPHLIHCLINGNNDIKVESCNALCNAIQFSASTSPDTIAPLNQVPKIIPFLISQGIMSPMLAMLTQASVDLRQRIVKSLDKIFAYSEALYQSGVAVQNEFVLHFIDCGGRDVFDSLIHEYLNDQDSDLNIELIREVEKLLNHYVIPNENKYYGTEYSVSTLSSDMSSNESYQYQFHPMDDSNFTKEDEVSSMAPMIGDNGFFKFG